VSKPEGRRDLLFRFAGVTPFSFWSFAMNAVVSPSVSSFAHADPALVAQNRAIKLAWLAYIRDNDVTAANHAVYALLRGKSLDKTFTPLTHPGKINANGGDPNRARVEAEAQARALSVSAWAPFVELLEGVPHRFNRYERIAHPLLDRVGAA